MPFPIKFRPATFFTSVLSAVLLFASAAYAAEGSYERYASIYRHPGAPSTAKNIAAHFLVYPFELVRWPVNESLLFTERHHIDKKAQWIYDQLGEHGLTPYANVISAGNLGGGLDLDLIRLTDLKDQFPDGVAKSWIQWSRHVNFEVGSRLGLERLGDTNFNTFGTFKYQRKPEEHFYGIGPNTSKGEGTNYLYEAVNLESSVGYKWGPTTAVDLKFGWSNVAIEGGGDGGRGQIDHIFSPEQVPGIDGDSLLHFTSELSHDTRNLQENSTRGGLGKVAFSYHEGLGDSNASFFKYEAEASRYIPLGAERRVLAIRFYGVHNDELNNGNVPFHQMAKLGGYGSYPRMSETLRGFDFNRFFDESAALMNLEYRYTIWQYRDFKLDTVAFWDEGQVFGEFSRFQMKDFRESYGGGFRVIAANHIILSLELAHGDEGTEFYVKSGAPF